MSGFASSSALRLPEHVLDACEAWQDAHLVAATSAIVPREHLHVTLAFLGSPARRRARRDRRARCAPRPRSAGPDLRLAAGRYRETRSVAMLVLEDVGGGATALAEDLQARLEAPRRLPAGGRGPGCRTSRWRAFGTVRASGSSRRPRRADGNVCSVRRGCLPVTTASRRGAVRRTGIDPL